MNTAEVIFREEKIMSMDIMNEFILDRFINYGINGRR